MTHLGDAPLSVLVLGDAPIAAEARAAFDACASIGILTDAVPLAAAAASDRVAAADLAVVVVDRDVLAAIAAIEALGGAAPGTPVVAACAYPRPDLGLELLRRGATDVVALPFTDGVVRRALHKADELRRLAGASSGGGEIWTVVGPKEGLGATTLVANLGIAVRRELRRDVAVVDLDLRHGELALALNLEPASSLRDVAAAADLDAVLVAGALTRHPSGLFLLAAGAGDDGPAPTTAQLAGVLAHLRAAHDVVLVDAPPPLSTLARVAAAYADRVLVPTELTVPSVRAAARTCAALARRHVGAGTVELVAMKRTGGAHEIAAADVRAALQLPIAAHVPRDDETAIAAINTGRALAEVSATAPATVAIRELARALVDGAARTAPRAATLL